MSSQDTPKESAMISRKTLQTLQHTSDQENLIGRPSKNLKHQLLQDVVDIEVKRKNVISKESQTNFSKITSEDLTNPERASDNYWKILAEKRQSALQEALDENEKLHKMIEELKEENSKYKVMLEEANSFVEIIKEELANTSKDDTGIDVNDVSTADETTEEIETKDT